MSVYIFTIDIVKRSWIDVFRWLKSHYIGLFNPFMTRKTLGKAYVPTFCRQTVWYLLSLNNMYRYEILIDDELENT